MNLSRIALNRIIIPSLKLAEFFEFAATIGVRAVELRNDLHGADVIDGMRPHEARDLAARNGLQILTINALQKFNLKSRKPELMSEIKELLALAQGLGCRAIVLCPNNDKADKRDSHTVFKETVEALAAFAPLFEHAGIFGYIEPLGFPECSLRSKLTALQAIRESGSRRYKVLHDTFHHAIGPDGDASLDGTIAPEDIGLVHISGVDAEKPAAGYRDEHRVLVGKNDKMGNKAQIEILERRGYSGFYSFEPFSRLVQTVSPSALATAIKESLANLG